MTTKEYVEYLLKHRRLLKRDLEQMEMQMEHLRNRKEKAETCEAKQIRQPSIYSEVQRRVSSVSYAQVEATHNALALELQRLETTMDALEERERKVLHCIYDLRMTWCQTGARLYLSRNTVARSRTRAIGFLISCFEAHDEASARQRIHCI